MRGIAFCVVFAVLSVLIWRGLCLLEWATFEGAGRLVGLVALMLLIGPWRWAWVKWGRGRL